MDDAAAITAKSIDRENPLGVDGFEFVEFTGPDPAAMIARLELMGFTATHVNPANDVVRLKQGDITLLVHRSPAGQAAAARGRWVEGPGAALFEAVNQALGPLPIIAEDLGVITPDVDALRRRLGLPGMRILQFAFDGDAGNRFLPHNHERDAVVYTGTHDNDTTAGWWAQASEHERHFARGYLATDGHDMPWALIRAACASVADAAIHPMQDVLALPSECRMNHPGQGQGWWKWRMRWSQVHAWHAERLAELGRLYGRDAAALPA